MKIRPGGGRCRLCREIVDPEHFHTPAQVILWLWDTGGTWPRIALIGGGVTAVLILANIITVAVTTVRETL